MSNDQPSPTDIDVLRRAAALLGDRLPPGWSAQLTLEPSVGGRRADGLIDISDASGDALALIVAARRTLDGRDVPAVHDTLAALVANLPRAQGLVVARYLSPSVRARLAARDLSYADATGNLRVVATSPGLFVADRGADRDPWRGRGRPLGSLKGAPAAKIVRAVTDIDRTWTTRELVAAAGSSTGSTYRVIQFLEREGLATRDAAGRSRITDWVAVLRRWSDNYGFVRNSSTTRWIAPRGLSDLIGRIARDTTTRYAVTGTLAAAHWAPYAPARAAMIYVDDAATAAAGWGLRPADAGANVVLAEPRIDVPFVRVRTTETGLTIAAPTQVAVDLMTGPGRNPSEAEELLEWMRRDERAWRT